MEIKVNEKDPPPGYIEGKNYINGRPCDADEEADDEDCNYIDVEPKFLLHVVGLTRGIVASRPSKYETDVQSPKYKHMTDIISHDVNYERPVLTYSSMHSCSGLVELGKEVFIAYRPDVKDQHNDCTHVIYLSVFNEGKNEQIVGIYPQIAQELVESAIEKNYLTMLTNVKQFKRDVPFFLEGKVDTKFDFCGICEDDIPFLMPVTNVHFADYADLPPLQRQRKDYRLKNRDSKIALYPDYSFHEGDILAETKKCIRDMTTVKRESIIKCILCYVVQRTDTDRFQPSAQDPEYRQILREAVEAGVIIVPIMVSWTREGRAYFIRDDVPVVKFYDI